jgi:hypothetical protein
MYLLYLDDSGSVPNTKEKYFVLGGICVPERSINWLTSKLDKYANKINPDDPSQVEFHSSEIFRGRTFPWNKYTKKERINIIINTLKCLDNANGDIVVFACAIHKNSYKNSDPMKIAFEDLCSRFDIYLNRIYYTTKMSHKGLIIFDKSTYENSLQKLSMEFRQEGTRWREVRNIREVPFFVDSKASRLIQLADHIAYSVFRRYNADDLTYFNRIENRFDRYQNTIHGLAHKQLYNHNCTCPACITRKNNIV